MREFEKFEEPKVETPPQPSAEEQAKEREVQLQAQAREKELEAAKANARAEAAERFVREQFAAGRTQAPPVEAVKAQQELGLSEEDILQDPAGAIAKLAEQIRRKDQEMVDYQTRVNSVVGNLAKSNFKSEMQALQKEQFSEWLMPYVEDYFRNNPQEAFNDGSVRRVYNELVGQNYAELDRLQREKTALPQQRERVVETPIRQGTSAPVKEEKRILGEDEEFMRVEMNRRLGSKYSMTPEEWRDIREGKKYPKQISTDIQVRGAKPNVSY